MRQYTITLNGLLNYGHDVTAWLNGDKIIGVTWSISAGFEIVNTTYDDSSFVIFIKPNGATIGDVCICTATFTTAAGLIDERSLSVAITKYR